MLVLFGIGGFMLYVVGMLGSLIIAKLTGHLQMVDAAHETDAYDE